MTQRTAGARTAGALRLAGAERIVAVDVARSLALFGMMAAHILTAPSFAVDELAPQGLSETVFTLVSGRAAPLFAVLAGVGLALATGGQTPPPPRRLPGLGAALLVRAVAVTAVGLLLVELDPPVAVILAYYGVLFLVAIPFLVLRAGPLLLIAVVWTVLAPQLSHTLRSSMPAGPGDQPGLEALAHPVELLTTLTLTGYYPVLPWVAYLLVGLAVGRLDLRARATAITLTGCGAGLALAAWAASGIALGPLGGSRALGLDVLPGQMLRQSFYGTTPTLDRWWLAVMSPHSSTPLDLAHTIGTSLLVLGLCLLVTRSPIVAGLTRPLAAAGSMTLTLYALHVVALAEQWGPEVWMVQAHVSLLVAHIVAAIVVATLWRARLRRGPLEAGIAAASGAARSLVSPST